MNKTQSVYMESVSPEVARILFEKGKVYVYRIYPNEFYDGEWHATEAAVENLGELEYCIANKIELAIDRDLNRQVNISRSTLLRAYEILQYELYPNEPTEDQTEGEYDRLKERIDRTIDELEKELGTN